MQLAGCVNVLIGTKDLPPVQDLREGNRRVLLPFVEVFD